MSPKIDVRYMSDMAINQFNYIRLNVIYIKDEDRVTYLNINLFLLR